MKRVAIMFLFGACFVFAPTAWCATRISMTVEPKKISMYDNASLQITIESDAQDVPEPKLPNLVDFQIFSAGSSQSVQVINGKVSSSVTYRYALSPRHPGRFNVGPAVVTINGTDYTTQVEVVTVNDVPANQHPAPGHNEVQPPPTKTRGEHHVFITASLDRDTVYVNQPVTYVFRFYAGERLLSNPEYNRPSFTNFWVEDLPPQRKYTTTLDGIPYDVTEIRTALFPAEAGVKTIAPAEVTATVRSQSRGNRMNPFNLFDDGFFDRGEPLHLATDALKLTVLSPPAGSPAPPFSGLVGKFTIDAKADVKSVNVGDPVTVHVTVSGEGNVKSIQRPYRDTLPNFRIFSGGSSEDVSTTGYEISGSKTFDEVFVPQRAGTYSLPAFELTYLDPQSHAYKTIKTEPISITVAGGSADFTIPSLNLHPDQLSDIAADVRFLKTEGNDLRRHESIGMLGTAFWFGHALPLLGLAGFFTWRRRVLKDTADPVGRRRRRARQSALRLLHGADPKSAAAIDYAKLSDALLGYYSDRYNLSAQGLTRAEMRARMEEGRLSRPTIDKYLELLDECDRGRYAPGGASLVPSDVLSHAEQVLVEMEQTR